MSQQLELLTENPSHWTTVCYIAPDIHKKEIKPFVMLALKELEGNPDSRLSSLTKGEKFAAIRQVLRHTSRLRSATNTPWRSDDINTFLESLRFSPECISELAPLLCTDQMYENMPRHLQVKPGLAGLQWKIDISLCQTNIRSENADAQRTKEIMHRDTHIILFIKLTDGQTNTYRLSISKFHELRYTIASALKCMIVLEKRKCMRKD